MGYTIDDTEDEQNSTGQGKKDESQTDISLGGGGSGTVGPGGSANAAPAPKPQEPSKSGSWTNLQSYLDANSDQGSQMGSQVAGTVEGQAKTAQSDVSNAAQAFSKGVSDNTVNFDAGQTQKAIDRATSLKSGESLAPEEISQFQKEYNANYGGPTDFTKDEGYGKAVKSLGTAQTSLGQTGSEAGRDVLLQNQYQNASANGYNQGERNLDQLLLENNPTNQKTFSDLRGNFSGLSSLLSDTTSAQNKAAQDAIATDTATKAATQGAFTKAQTDYQAALDARVAAQNAARGKQYSDISNDLYSGQLSDEEAAALGLNPGQQLFSLNPASGQFLTQNGPVNKYQVASADDYARMGALSQLSGQENTYLPGSQASQSGQILPAYTFNKAGFNSALDNVQRDYKTAAQQANDSIASYAPMPGDWLRSTSTRSIEQNLADLSAARDQISKGDSGNKAYLLSGLDKAIAQYSDIQNRYRVGRTIGGGLNSVMDIPGHQGGGLKIT